MSLPWEASNININEKTSLHAGEKDNEQNSIGNGSIVYQHDKIN